MHSCPGVFHFSQNGIGLLSIPLFNFQTYFIYHAITRSETFCESTAWMLTYITWYYMYRRTFVKGWNILIHDNLWHHLNWVLENKEFVIKHLKARPALMFLCVQMGITQTLKTAFLNSLPASGKFCHLLIIFANSLDPDQARQNVGPDLDPNRITLW